MKLFSFVPGWSSIVVTPSLWTTTMTVIIAVYEIFKTLCSVPHHLWVGPNDGNTFGNASWNDVHRKISYKDSFNFVVCENYPYLHFLSVYSVQSYMIEVVGTSEASVLADSNWKWLCLVLQKLYKFFRNLENISENFWQLWKYICGNLRKTCSTSGEICSKLGKFMEFQSILKYARCPYNSRESKRQS